MSARAEVGLQTILFELPHRLIGTGVVITLILRCTRTWMVAGNVFSDQDERVSSLTLLLAPNTPPAELYYI